MRVACGLLLVVGALLIQACSDNKGSSGPTFACRENTIGQKTARSGSVRTLAACTASPAPVVGDAIGGPEGTLFVQVTINPGTVTRGRRASVLVIVTNINGKPLQGRRVQLAPSAGQLDQTTGLTDVNGLFSTTLLVPCEVTPDTSIGVAAVVEGVTAQAAATVAPATAVTSSANDPCPPLAEPEPEPAV
jgi:hypothetical protein